MKNTKLIALEKHLKSQLALLRHIKASKDSNNPRKILFLDLLYHEISDGKKLYYNFHNKVDPLDYALFEDTDKPCIYLIEDFYIGKTKNLKRRIKDHIVEAALSVTVSKATSNIEKSDRILVALNKGKLKVKILSYDISDERSFIVSYLSKGYDLVNKQLRKPKK